MNMEDGIVSLSDFTRNVKPETKQEVLAANLKMRSRTFDVFYGPITDNMGNLRVEAGESMSDSEMLNGFDWCVEGVTVEE
jgi:basic membrane protein A